MSKNIIINGGIDILQLGNYFPSTQHFTRTADRFVFGQSNGDAVYNVSIVEESPDQNSKNSIKITTTQAASALNNTNEAHIRYAIEGYDFSKIIGTKKILRFRVRTNKIGKHTVAFVATNNVKTYLHEYDVYKKDTWQIVSVPVVFNPSGVTFNTTNSYGVKIRWAFRAGSNFRGNHGEWNNGNLVGTHDQVDIGGSVGDYIQIAQVELKDAYTTEEYTPELYIDEYLRCLRYLYIMKHGGTSLRLQPSSVNTGSVLKWQIPFPVPMREASSAEIGGIRGTNWQIRDMSDTSNTTGTQELEVGTENWGTVRFNDGIYVAGKNLTITSLNSDCYIKFDAEL